MGAVNRLPASSQASVLDQLYAKLEPFQGKSLDLCAQLAEGRIRSFLAPLGSASTFTIDGASIAYPEPHIQVSVTGSFVGLSLETMKAAVAFTLAADGATLQASVDLEGALKWTWQLAPWLSLRGPDLKLVLSDSTSVPAVADLAIAVGTGDANAGAPAAVGVLLPGPDADTWLFSGTFPPGADVSHLFSLLGGVNLASYLPGPLADLSKLGVEQIAVLYNYETGEVASMSAQLGATVRWPLLPGHTADVTGIGVQATVWRPASAATVSWLLTGTIEIGEGLVEVVVAYPHPLVTASLDPNTKISMSEFVSRFIDHEVDLHADVVSFYLTVALEAPYAYSIAADISTGWSIPIPGGGTIEITDLAFGVAGDERARSGRIAGTTVIASTVTFVLSAEYANDEEGWVFEAKETEGKIPLVELVDHYLPDEWKVDPASASFNIEALDTRLAPKTGSYSISGALDAHWDILGGFALEASAAVAYDGKNYTGHVEATLEEAFGLTDLGLKLSYSFAPKNTIYALSWKGLSGTYTKPSDSKEHAILSIEVKDWTLGELIEELVSFATGAKFSLASPWDLLDEIPLDCTLSFDLTAGSIAFTYPLSIDLGIAAVSGITVTYDRHAEHKVAVALDGRFPWQEDPSKPLGWDASDPQSTPVPPGSGGKYLDLRVLGLGQHVALETRPRPTRSRRSSKLSASSRPRPPGSSPSTPPRSSTRARAAG